jgi:hypothetical protein
MFEVHPFRSEEEFLIVCFVPFLDVLPDYASEFGVSLHIVTKIVASIFILIGTWSSDLLLMRAGVFRKD